MRYIFLTVFYLLICQFSFSQNNRIIYRAEYSFPKMDNSLKSVSEEKKKRLEYLKNSTEDVCCFLDFNKNTSVFYIDDKMMFLDNRKFNLTKTKVDKGVFFTNTDMSEIINQKNSFGSDFSIIYPKNEWNITQKTKKIGKYVCYKATTQIEIEGRWGKKTIPIIAWFTLDLPYRFGPKQFSGLPGIVLELTEGELTFYAQKINLNQIGLKLKEKNKKGETITLDKFNQFQKKMFKR